MGLCIGGIGALLCCAAPAWAQEETPARTGTSAVGCQVLTPQHLEGYSTVSQALRGQVTGLTLWETSGQVGAGSSVGLRGPSSLQGYTPLVFIDGIKVSDTPDAPGQVIGALDQMNPTDVLLIEIFRGPSATTMYGTEAAGGIIRVYTMHGSKASDVIDDVKARCVP
jgi:outer membrane cobalamin receptor